MKHFPLLQGLQMPWLDVWDGAGAGSNSWALSERYSRLRRIAIVWVFPSFHLSVV